MKKWNVLSNDSGVSEVIGTILLLGISVTLFSVVYITVLSFPGAPSTPSSNIAMSLNETSVILFHTGGKPLSLDSEIKITVDEIVNIYKVTTGLNQSEKQDNFWGFGEQFVLNFSEIGITPDMIEYNLDVTVIDVDSNSVVMMGTKTITNKPPIIGSPFPYNKSIKVSVGISQLQITISDPDNDAFFWSIETNPNIGHNSGSMQKYIGNEFSCIITTKLKTSSVYIWYVNATDINGKSTNKTYTFITGYSADHKIAVDSNTSNVDGSVDKGLETYFVNAQANTTDGNVMIIEETSYGNQDYTTAVQGNTTNNDGSSPADYGTDNGFINAKETSRDSDYMYLLESDAGIPSGDENKTVDGWVTSVGWSTTGSAPYIGADDYPTAYISASKNTNSGWATYQNTTATTGNINANLYINMWASTGTPSITVYWDLNSDGSADGQQSVTVSTDNSKFYSVSIGSITYTQANALRTYFKSSSTTATYLIDQSKCRFYWSAAPNYRLDQEYNWSTTHYSESTEQLCIYVNGHTGGSEYLMVKYWTGSTWNWLGNITATGWTNLTAFGLTSGTYTIRLNGSKATNNAEQDTWEIDCMFLHTYNSTNNRIDFEYQWTDANFTDTQKQVCLYITSRTGTETLNINYRNGTTWTTIGTITGTGWVNVTATGLSTSTYTIQLIGVIETADAEKGTWNIDCLYLHTWT